MIFSASGGATSKSSADAAFNAGLDALKSGNEAAALPIVAGALLAHPDDARLWQVSGLLHRALDDLAPAVAALEKAARLAPQDAKIALGHAHAALEAGLPAANLFDAVLRLDPTLASARLGRAAAHFAEHRADEAIRELDDHLLRQPAWLEGHWLLARLRWALGDQAGFTASLERALRASPGDVGLWRQLIATFMHARKYADALDAIGRARKATGESAGLGFSFSEAACRTELGELEEAERLFQSLPASSETEVAIYRIRHLLRSGRPLEAAAAAEPLLRTSNSHLVWPYLSVAWRMVDDERWNWLEGDGRFVGVYDIGEKLPPLDDLAVRLRALHPKGNQPLEQSVRGGTQTDGPLFSRVEPEIRTLRKAVVETVERHVAQLPAPVAGHPLLSHKRQGRIRFSGSWSVRLLANGHHSNHVHPGGWLSSALYVHLPAREERGQEPAGWLSLGQPERELGVDLPPVLRVEPKPGRLVLFPSTMWHGTYPFDDGERLTVAFDVAHPR